ncbi:hypothetical protein SCHPADRAFT_599490 [Schizopora paradoxa]|uniref:Smr domain-containing protein n=1 Tax=Schizopora paradoxa TaxID=27342 RepID=A0A0H2R9Z1_9AGAM|nr:hypothetical protein SCHPADRAFT_599490 [Schizopora paradoxa]
MQADSLSLRRRNIRRRSNHDFDTHLDSPAESEGEGDRDATMGAGSSYSYPTGSFAAENSNSSRFEERRDISSELDLVEELDVEEQDGWSQSDSDEQYDADPESNLHSLPMLVPRIPEWMLDIDEYSYLIPLRPSPSDIVYPTEERDDSIPQRPAPSRHSVFCGATFASIAPNPKQESKALAEQHRKLAKAAVRKRNCLLDKRKEALCRGDEEEARALERKDAKQQELILEHNRIAAAHAFEYNNKYCGAAQRLELVNLHNLHVEEAKGYTLQHIHACMQRNIKRTRIITGRGSHSVDNIPKIRPAIEELLVTLSCVKNCFRFPDNEGMLLVCLKAVKAPVVVGAEERARAGLRDPRS